MRRIGQYELHREIATGGQASLHLGRFVGTAGFSRTVAIKRLHRHLSHDAGLVAMLLDEARIASRILHPNVVPIVDVVAETGEVLLVMDLVHGASLADLLARLGDERGGVPPAIASAIAVGALQGLHAAHEATDDDGVLLEIVHRDVSPQNILVGADGVTRVVDFGVAKAIGRLQHTADDQLKGKIAYMPPEQLRKEPLDRRADVYAAGVVVWEMLTGRRLFGGDPVSAMFRILEGKISPPSEVEPSAAAFDAAVLRATALDPADRHATAQSFADDLSAAIPPASAEQVARWVAEVASAALSERAALLSEMETSARLRPSEPARKRRLFGALVGSLVIGLGLVSAYAWLRPREPPTASPNVAISSGPIASVDPPLAQCGGPGQACCEAGSCAAAHLTCHPVSNLCGGCVVKLFSGPASDTTCARTEKNGTYCWGDNNMSLSVHPGDGQLLSPTRYTYGRDPSHMAMTRMARLAVIDGKVYGWGQNLGGELGRSVPIGDFTTTPTLISESLSGVTSVSLVSHPELGAGCAVADGRAYCWGTNQFGALGAKRTADSLRHLDPIALVMPEAAASERAAQVEIGGAAAGCLGSERGWLACWGNDRPWRTSPSGAPPHSFQGSYSSVAELVDRPLTGFALSSQSACYMNAARVLCWGGNQACEVKYPASEGVERTTIERELPPGLKPGLGMDAGSQHFCLLDDQSRVWCWGKNLEGQVGQTPSTQVCTPTLVDLPRRATALALGHEHSCVLDELGLVRCFGRNTGGELGRGTKGAADPKPEIVPVSCEAG